MEQTLPSRLCEGVPGWVHVAPILMPSCSFRVNSDHRSGEVLAVPEACLPSHFQDVPLVVAPGMCCCYVAVPPHTALCFLWQH